MIWPLVLVVLIYADGVTPTGQSKNTAGCSARVRCGGKIEGIVERRMMALFLLVFLERSEQLSMTVQGLPGPPGLQGSTGNCCQSSVNTGDGDDDPF